MTAKFVHMRAEFAKNRTVKLSNVQMYFIFRLNAVLIDVSDGGERVLAKSDSATCAY